MSERIPRLRMFAGPNGSGKSTLKSCVAPDLIGVYVNPDELEQAARTQGMLHLESFGVTTTTDEVLPYFTSSPFLSSVGLDDACRKLTFADGWLDFSHVSINSYLASVFADFLRHKLLEARISFTFETVMSHPGKVDLLNKAQQAGYRTYLYYVATDDPAINISRVRNRVQLGGHPVPENLIESRYYRSLELLLDAIRRTNRAYIFDNSGENRDQKHTWLAEVTEGKVLELKCDRIPAWFRHAVLDKINVS